MNARAAARVCAVTLLTCVLTCVLGCSPAARRERVPVSSGPPRMAALPAPDPPAQPGVQLEEAMAAADAARAVAPSLPPMLVAADSAAAAPAPDAVATERAALADEPAPAPAPDAVATERAAPADEPAPAPAPDAVATERAAAAYEPAPAAPAAAAAAQPLLAAVAAGTAAAQAGAAAALPWPRLAVFELALRAYRCGDQEGYFRRPVLTIIDYSLPATERRLWVVDLSEGRVLHHELVAHGDQSGENLAVAFSNRIDSHQSSLGLFRTDDAYTGQFGYALRLSGLEPGINDNARARSIVFHGSPDVSPEFAAQWGTIGRSWGCPALPQDSSMQVIDGIADGTAVFAFYPDAEWLRGSRYLHCDDGLAAGVASANH